MGPLQALLGHLIFPFIWRVLETLMTAKMARMFPNNSGYVGWIFVGFDPFWGFQRAVQMAYGNSWQLSVSSTIVGLSQINSSNIG